VTGSAPLLSLDVAGAGDPLVLLHGLATDRHIWGTVVPALARRRRVITVDLPGFGESSPVGDGFELDEVADRIARGIASHRIRGPFELVGHSLGAGVALTLAVARPRLVSRLVLVAPAGLQAMPDPAPLLLAAGADALLAARRSLVGLTDLAWGRRLLLALTAADGASIPPALARQMVNASASALRTAPALATITAADLRPLLRRVRAPLGVIWGEQDRTVPARLASTITSVRPDVELALLDGAGHVPMIERPDAFVAALLGLLGRLAGPGRASQRRNNSFLPAV
jgi:pimeloyl-ACP methyl ester carboxylesterase